jgi:hypothetical protein
LIRQCNSLRDKIRSEGILIDDDTADNLVRYFRNECILLSEDEDSPFFKNGNGKGNGNGKANKSKQPEVKQEEDEDDDDKKNQDQTQMKVQH